MCNSVWFWHCQKVVIGPGPSPFLLLFVPGTSWLGTSHCTRSAAAAEGPVAEEPGKLRHSADLGLKKASLFQSEKKKKHP